MDERNYGINWLGLFIKVIVFVVVVLLAIWLFSKLTLKNKGLSFEENNKKFQDATVEYFKKNLPEEGKSLTVTLNKLIAWDYLDELKNEKGKTCDVKNSKSKIELVEDYYNIKTIFVCDNKSETTYIKLGNEECAKCDIKVKGLKINKKEDKKEETKKEETNTESNETSKGSINQTNNTNKKPQNNTTNQNNTQHNQTVLYEYVKEVNEYSDWYVGKVTGDNIENSKEKVSYSKYCKTENYTYRTVGYVTTKQNYTYTLELMNLYNVSSVEYKNSNYFTTLSDYKNYLEKKYKDLEMVGESGKKYDLPSATTIRNSSLDSTNFKYTVSEVYKKNNNYYVDITVNIKNLNGVEPYYESNIKSSIYYVPIEFTITYTDENNCLTDKTDNSDNYYGYKIVDKWSEKIDIYRYRTTILEYKYTNATSLEGYKKTGKTKIAS